MSKLSLTQQSALALTLTLAAAGAHAQDYFNVSVGGAFAPGVFGEISIGSAPPPPVINTAPVLVAPVVQGATLAYLYVPDQERANWSRYCDKYSACNRPVHFVQVGEQNRWWEHRQQERRMQERREERREDRRYEERREDRRDDHARERREDERR
jgi:hypothetical protein